MDEDEHDPDDSPTMRIEDDWRGVYVGPLPLGRRAASHTCEKGPVPLPDGPPCAVSSDESFRRDVVQTSVLGAVAAYRPEGPIRCSRDGVDLRIGEVPGPGVGPRVNARRRFIVVETGGHTLLITLANDPSRFDARNAELQTILDSITFE